VTCRTVKPMHDTRRKGFTLIELIIVIVVIAILAGISIATFTAVIRRANVSSVENSALSFNRELIALAAQRAAAGNQTGTETDRSTRSGQLLWEALNSTAITGAADGPRGVKIVALADFMGINPWIVWDGSQAQTAAPNDYTDPNKPPLYDDQYYLQFMKSGASVCLRLSANSTQAYDLTPGGTPMGQAINQAYISDATASGASQHAGWLIMRRRSTGASTGLATTNNACNNVSDGNTNSVLVASTNISVAGSAW
jgi:prepilin-type N-terminal cleavage/methylation domain-containing protein